MFTAIVFEGSGFNGLSYVGVIRELEHRDFIKNIRYFAGASSGAFISTMLAFGFTSHDIEKILKEINTSEIVNTCFLRQVYNLIRYYGLHKRSKMRAKLAQIFDMKYHPTITFGELYRQSGNILTIVVTDLTTKKPLYINKYNNTNTPIIDILTASLSFPGVFIYDKQTGFIDGGFSDNYPIWIYNDINLLIEEKHADIKCLPIPTTTLGIKLDETNEHSINHIFHYISSILDTMANNLGVTESPNYTHQTIRLVGMYNVSLNFEITSEKMDNLISYGITETRKFLEHYENL
jgi:NTE family protein